MSQILKETPEWARTLDPLGRPCKYDWNEWLDGQSHLLVRSTPEYPDGDYDTETRFFRHTVLRAAERRGVEVDIIWKSGRNFEDKRDRMIVQAKQPSHMQYDTEFIKHVTKPLVSDESYVWL